MMLDPVVCVARTSWETQDPGKERVRALRWGAEKKRKWFIWQSCLGAKTKVKTAGGLTTKVEVFREKLVGREEHPSITNNQECQN